jgi:uncharacterized Zn-finger protein
VGSEIEVITWNYSISSVMNGTHMKLRKVYINDEQEGEIICPRCKKKKTINVSNRRIPQKPIKIKCYCGHTFNIELEYRKHHRKIVNIPGKIFQRYSNKEIDDVIVISLSVTGLGFETRSLSDIKINDLLEIEFTLDDDFDSIVREEIVVKRVEGNFIGAEFFDQDKYHYELDFYIMPQLSIP